MPPKYDYRRRLPHIQKDNRPIFITFTTDHRWELPAQARNIVLECCLKENGSKFDLHTDKLTSEPPRPSLAGRILRSNVLRSNDSLAEKADYICQNPVRAGLVKAEDEYPWLWRNKIPIL